MLINYLLLSAALLLVYMTLWFVLAKKKNQLNMVDVAWGGGFVLVAWTMYVQTSSARSLMLAVLVTMWGARLTRHLYKRVIGGGKEDPRYEAIKSKWKGNVWLRAYFSIFLLQGVLILLISAPVVVSANATLAGMQWAVYAGAAVWFIGFTFERIADAQLAEFVADNKNKGKVLNTGLWRYSRHPNYFGEITQWWGIGIIALQASYGWIGFIGPLTLTILIVFVSGIPLIENRKKSNPEYTVYMQHTSKLFPLPPKS